MVDEVGSFVMNIDALSDHEITYELEIRGATATGTSRQKRMELKRVIEQENTPPMIRIINDDDFNNALRNIDELLETLRVALSKDNKLLVFATKSRLRHQYDRAMRASGEDEAKAHILRAVESEIQKIFATTEKEEQYPVTGYETQHSSGRGRGSKSASVQSLNNSENRRSGGLGSMEANKSIADTSNNSLMSNIQTIADEIEKLKISFRELNERRSESNVRSDPTTHIHHYERDQPRKMVEMPQTSYARRAKIEEWPVRFSGEDDTSLTEFLWKVELYAKSDVVPKIELFKGIFRLLKGNALEWYEVNVDNFRNWDELVRGMQARFLSNNYDFMMREEVLQRIQGANESMAVYLTQMSKLFRKIYPPLEESYKVYILMRNMLPEYRMQLSTTKMISVEQVEELCRQIEEAKLMDNRRIASGSASKPLEPTCFPIKRSTHRIAEVKEVAEVNRVPMNQVPGNRFRTFSHRRGGQRDRMITCWNCHQPGHRHFDCERPKERVYCWCCGLDGVTADRCPRNHKGGKLFLPDDPSGMRRAKSGNGPSDE